MGLLVSVDDVGRTLITARLRKSEQVVVVTTANGEALRHDPAFIFDARSLMAVNLRWALVLACAVVVRGKYTPPPGYFSTSLRRRLAASPPVDGAVARLQANFNPNPNPTLAL